MKALSTLPLGISDKCNSSTGYALTTYQFPNDELEITARYVNTNNVRPKGGAKRKNTTKDQMDVQTLAISSSRSKTATRRKVLTFCPSILMTLTFRKNVTDLDEAWGCFKYFSKLMRHVYGDEWIYVCVPEKQKRGAWHFHLAVTDRFHNKTWSTLHVLWGRAVGKREGNVDIQTRKKKFGKDTKIHKPNLIAQYLCKYITKDANAVGFNKRRYSSAGVKPVPITGWVNLAFTGIKIEELLESLFDALSEHPIEIRYHSPPDDFLNIYYYST